MDNQLMTIILLLLIVIILFLLFFIYQLSRKKADSNLKADIQLLSQNLSQLYNYEEKQHESTTRIEERTRLIVQALNNLHSSSSGTNQQIQNVFEKVNAMNNIMVNKKTRGNWGEYQLQHLLSVYAGESQEIYETQYLLKNKYIGDVALHLPNSDKVLIIDSKFPAENYQRLCEDLNEHQLRKYHSLFKQDIKKHIHDISTKYITNETSENAVMFIPSEAIYFYLCSECSDLIDFAHKQHVLMTSPTTLLGVIFTLINITKDINRSKNIKALEKDIVSMYEDALRLEQRINTLETTIEKIQKPLKEVSTSTHKIVNKISKIYDGYSDDEKS